MVVNRIYLVMTQILKESGSSLNSSASNVYETPAVLNNSDTPFFSESSQATVDNIEETSGEVLGYATNPVFSNISFVVDALNSGMEFGHPSVDSIVNIFVILRHLYCFLNKFYIISWLIIFKNL